MRLLSPRWKKITRDVWLHKARTALALAAIVIGLIAAGTVLDAWSLVRRATIEQYGASNPPAMTIHVDSVDTTLVAHIRSLPGVAAARRRRTAGISLRHAAGTAGGSVVVVDDYADPRIGALTLEEGAWPASDTTIVVERSSVDFVGTALGATVDVRAGDGASRHFVVSGIARDVGIPPGWMDHDVTLFGIRQTLARLGLDPSFTEIQVTLRGSPRDIVVVRRASRDIAAAIERQGHRVSRIDVPPPGRHPHAGQMNSLLVTQGAFGLLAALLSGFLVINLVGAMLAGQVREIGIMMAIGARRWQIATLYLALATALGVVAGAIALPIAALAGRLYAQFSAQLLNFDVTHVAIPWWSIAAQVCTAIILPVAAAAIPVVRACSVTISSAVRGESIDDRARGEWLQRCTQFASLPRPVSLALRMVARRPARSAMAILTIAMGGAVFLGARSLRSGVIASVDALYSSYRFDVSLRFSGAHNLDSLEAAVRALPGVRGAEAWMRTSGQIAFADGSMGTTFSLVGTPARTALFRANIVAGRWLAPSDGRALVVSTRLLSDEPSLAVGDVVPIRINGRVEPWTIVGAAETGFDAGAYASRDAVAHATGERNATGVVVDIGDTTTLGRLGAIDRARETLRGTAFELRSGQMVDAGRDAIEDHLVMVVGFLGAMAQIMIVVGGLGLASTMSIAVIERTREIGVLRAIGATPGKVQLLVHVESLFLVALSSLVAVVASMPIGIGLGAVFGRIMIPVTVRLVPGAVGVLEWIGIAVVVSTLAALWPARRASRIQIREALAYE
jgi:putative ABC transport system permease protein